MNLIINPQFESLCPPLSEERDAAWAVAQEARAEADHAKADQVRMAGDVATMFDDLRTGADKHAELHAARARLQADVDRLNRVYFEKRSFSSSGSRRSLTQSRSATAQVS
jgi:hypothetical protein